MYKDANVLAEVSVVTQKGVTVKTTCPLFSVMHYLIFNCRIKCKVASQSIRNAVEDMLLQMVGTGCWLHVVGCLKRIICISSCGVSSLIQIRKGCTKLRQNVEYVSAENQGMRKLPRHPS